MNKDKLSSWTLVISVFLLIGGLMQVSSPTYAESIYTGVGTLAIASVFGIATWRLRVSVRVEKQKAAAAAAEKREKTEEDMRRIRENLVEVTFPVAGVTFKNRDGLDRQKILLEISFNPKTDTDFWLVEEDKSLGDDSGIMVMTDYGCVGYIRRSDKAEARRFVGKQNVAKFLRVENFVNDENKTIYRADAKFLLSRDSLSDQWYFKSSSS